MTLAELKSKYRRVSSLEKARSGWENEYEVSSKQVKFLDNLMLLGCSDKICKWLRLLFVGLVYDYMRPVDDIIGYLMFLWIC